MAYTTSSYSISGASSYPFTFDYIDESEVKVEVDGTEISSFNVRGKSIDFEGHTAPSGTTIRIFRRTNLDESKVKFAAGSAIRAGDLNTLTNQLLYSAQETDEKQLDITKTNTREASVTANTNDAAGLYDFIQAFLAQNGTGDSFEYRIQSSATEPTYRPAGAGVNAPLVDGDVWYQPGNPPTVYTRYNGAWIKTSFSQAEHNNIAALAGTVATDQEDLGLISDSLSAPSSNPIDFASILANIDAIEDVAAISTEIGNLAADATALTDLEVVANDLTTLADLGSISNPVTTSAGTNYISEVGQNIADVTAVAGQITPTNNIASIVSNATDISTVASSIGDVNRYAEEYLIAAESTNNPPTPVPPNQNWSATSGDLWYNTTTTGLYYFTGSAWNATGGAQGPAGTITIGSVTTGLPGTNAAVTNSGSASAATLNFTIPQGDQGDAATVSVGSVTTGLPGTSAAVTNSGSSSAATLNFTIPEGDQGLPGNPGADGTLISYAGTAPTSPATNDFWIDSSTTNNTLKQWNGTAWTSLFDIEGADGSDGSDGTEIYYQTTQPTGGVDGDFWVDSDSTGKELWRKESGTWNQKFQMGMDLTPTQLSDVSAVANDLAQNNDLGSITNNVTNTNTGGSLQTVASNLSDINAFNNRYQISPTAGSGFTNGPLTRSSGSALVEGDLYFDTTTDVLRAYNGTTWGDVTLSSSQLSDVSAVANDIASNNDLGLISNNVVNTNTGGSLQTCATNIADINTVAGNTTNVNAVAGGITNINAVATNATNVNTVAANIADVNSFANTYFIEADSNGAPQNISAGTITEGDLWYDTTNNILKVYDSASTAWVPATLSSSQLSDVAAVANDISQNNDLGSITAPASNTGTGGSLQTCASNIADINTVAAANSNIQTVVSNLSSINSFAKTYFIASNNSGNPNGVAAADITTGDLWFDSTNSVLKYYANSTWTVIQTGYGNSDVDSHLNQSSASSGQLLSWNGSDYDWIAAPSTYGDSDVNTHLNSPSSGTNSGKILSWNGSDYAWVDDNNTTYSVGDGGLTQKNFTTTLKTKLDGIATGAEVNVKSDWNASSGDAQILNKPTIPTNNNQLTNGAGYITSTGTDENFTTALKNKLNGIAAGAEVNVQSDWNASSGDAQILNKPTIPTTLGGLSDVSTSGASNTNLLGYNGSSWAPVAAPSGTTNLGIGTITSTTVPVTSSTGTDATLPAATQSDAGVMSSTDKTKLDGVETGATADQTAAEIRTLVEAATDSNVFTDADHTKLNGIATGATAYSDSDVDSRLASYTGVAADYILSRNSSNNGFEWIASSSGGGSLTAQQLADVNTVATDLASSNDLGSIASALTNSSTGGALNTCATNITDIQTVAASFSATGTLSDTELDNYSETVSTVSGSTLSASTAHIHFVQYYSNTTITLSLNNGQSMLVMINAGNNTITWTGGTIVWAGGSAPSLNTSGSTGIEFFKVNGIIFAAAVGDF